jgi:DNA-binding CsgD family transcriptional regulator
MICGAGPQVTCTGVGESSRTQRLCAESGCRGLSTLVGSHRVISAERGSGQAGADDVDAVERRLGRDRLGLALEAQLGLGTRFLSYRFPGKLGGGCDARYRPSVADDLSDLFSARQSGALVVSIDGLAKLFELTPSEQAVARSLVNGADPREIAEERHNSIETVRSHLKSIFSKTGARSQLALMRLAVKANPPVDAA